MRGTLASPPPPRCWWTTVHPRPCGEEAARWVVFDHAPVFTAFCSEHAPPNPWWTPEGNDARLQEGRNHIPPPVINTEVAQYTGMNVEKVRDHWVAELTPPPVGGADGAAGEPLLQALIRELGTAAIPILRPDPNTPGSGRTSTSATARWSTRGADRSETSRT